MSEDLDQFRAETRAWLEANCPPAMRTPMRSEKDATWGGRNPVFAHPDQKLWMDRMGARGWTVPDWPKAYGGGGLSPAETKILREELKRISARNPLNSFGISMLGPGFAEIRHRGAEARASPKIARGEIRWCQGYSEPNAGSDLAGLATSAEDGRPFPRQRPEGLDQLCRPGRLDLLPRPHRQESRSRPGSASCCSTWPAKACRPGRSC
jgi:acyl-CoA dehydrogenase